MPWTKISYPAAMRKLPAAVRNKAIEIANAMLKKNKKMKEGIILATSIKHAKEMAAKSEKKAKDFRKKKTKVAARRLTKGPAKKKVKVAAKQKVKSLVKKKTTGYAKKRVKRSAKTIVKIAAKKKIKSPARKKVQLTARKISKGPEGKKPITFVRKRISQSIKELQGPVTELSPSEIIANAEGIHSIPGQGGMHPVTTWESHQIEKGFHHREEVAFHQENQKVKQAKAARKNSKRTYRMTGQR